MSRWWEPSPSSAIKPIPWLAPKVIQYLENIIQPDFEVLEHGSGGSTLWFAERCKWVTSFENNPDWIEIVSEKAPGNVTLTDMKAFILSRSNCDLLLIDGEPVEARADWLTQAPTFVKPGGWVVLDNANRPEYAAEREALRQYADLVETFDSNEGVTKYLVTDFWKMKAGADENRQQPEPQRKGSAPRKGGPRRRNPSA